MAVIVCHSPKGGVGTTLVAAHLASRMAASGRDVCLLGAASSGSPSPHFGKAPSLALPALTDPAIARVPGAVDLRRHRGAASDPDLLASVERLGFGEPHTDRLLIVDVAAGQPALAARLTSIAAIRLCVLTPAPDALAALPDLIGMSDPARDLFVLNNFDETRRVERHGAALAREVLGPRLLGRIRRDVCVIEAIASLQPLSLYAPASAALADLCALADIVAERLIDVGDTIMSLPMSAIVAA